MTTDKRQECGTCGARARFMGSHVMSAHTGYAAGQPAYVTALTAEREAREYSIRRADYGWQAYGHDLEAQGAAEGYGTVADRPEWTRRLVAKDFTYSLEG